MPSDFKSFFGARLTQAMRAADFLIPARADATLRAFRALLLRAEPTAEEAALITALARAFDHAATKGEP